MVDRWAIFVVTEFVSAALGFLWGLISHNQYIGLYSYHSVRGGISTFGASRRITSSKMTSLSLNEDEKN